MSFSQRRMVAQVWFPVIARTAVRLTTMLAACGFVFGPACSGANQSTGNLRDDGSAGSRAVAQNTAGGSDGANDLDVTDSIGGAPACVQVISPVDKADILFMIDNSISMEDKQQIFQTAVPDLVSRLVNPVCVDSAGVQHSADTPLDPIESCPRGLTREFAPLTSVNLGIISSSLGGFGSDNSSCTLALGSDAVDMAHLLGSLPRGATALGPSQNLNPGGFLEWRAGNSPTEFHDDVSRLLTATGSYGCGLEASLEAWYRFLVDPEPYETLEHVPCDATDTAFSCVSPRGVDQALLAQRAAFLRPDSLVAVIVLSDENDCSVRVDGQGWRIADKYQRMFRAAAVCSTAPNDPCCYSCGSAPPDGCAEDVACGSAVELAEASDYLEEDQDELNLRCFQNKKRFGTDFLYPTARYVNALSQAKLCLHPDRPDLDASNCPADGRLVDNPLYAAAAAGEKGARDPSLVFLAGIVGVPWQDIAVDPKSDTLSYQATENIAWDVILGDGYSPADPLMVESVAPRSGINPTTGAELAPPSAAQALANPINGHEWDAVDDLQYACIFPLAEARDCGALGPDSVEPCDCWPGLDGLPPQDNSPLCQSPITGEYSAMQYFAKAYPGLRQLQTLKGFGAVTGNAIVASICPRNMADNTRQDFGYRPAIAAITERLRARLIDRCRPPR